MLFVGTRELSNTRTLAVHRSRSKESIRQTLTDHLDIIHFHLVVFFCEIWADEELVDQKKYLEEACKPKCVKPFLQYQSCIKRIKDDETGHKHCTGQYFDYWSCVDHCVAPRLFEKLK